MNFAESVTALRSRLSAIGQEHLLSFFDNLTDDSKAKLLSEIENLDFESIPGWIDTYIK